MNVYMPPPANLSPEIWRSRDEVFNQIEGQKRDREAILNYLAEAGKPEPARTYIPETGQSRCCDTTIFDIFLRIVCNPCRLVKDAACGCFPACAMPTPEDKTYMPEQVYNRLRSADVYLNRNTCLLCCVTPVVLSCFPFVGFLPLAAKKMRWLSAVAGCSTNDCGIFSAGCLTYFWSGDFGGREQKSYEELKVIFDDLADYLDQKRKETERSGDTASLKQLCERLRRNSRNIMEGLKNAGISSLHAQDITKKFFLEILEILKGEPFASIDQLDVSEAKPPRQLLMHI
ncbi:MAG: hypothetical protein LLG04_06955 [Parachlamydia sp.]|nr:hypothetical protein [Parachlamydia sp.]